MIINSGGASGSDELFQSIAQKFNINYTNYSFQGHQTKAKNRTILTQNQLQKAKEYVVRAAMRLNRHFPSKNVYINNLLCRNYYIIQNATIVIAIGRIINNTIQGGTAWGCEMAKETNTPIYIYELYEQKWKKYTYNSLEPQHYYNQTPILHDDDIIAGIGTRNIGVNITHVNSVIQNLFLPLFVTNNKLNI